MADRCCIFNVQDCTLDELCTLSESVSNQMPVASDRAALRSKFHYLLNKVVCQCTIIIIHTQYYHLESYCAFPSWRGLYNALVAHWYNLGMIGGSITKNKIF